MKKKNKKSKRKKRVKRKKTKLKNIKKVRKKIIISRKKRKNKKKKKKRKNINLKKNKNYIPKTKNQSLISKIVKFQLSIKSNFDFKINLNPERYIQSFFDKISETISNYKVIKKEEKRRIREVGRAKIQPII